MALIGLSLILASLVYLAIRRPPLMETLLALWRGDPKIERPPNTTTRSEDPARNGPSITTMPPPPTITKTTGTEEGDGNGDTDSSAQTTPKASATHLTDSGVPTFTLSPEPPASAAAVARSRSSSLAGGANPQPPVLLPSLSGAAATAPLAGAMAPPPPSTLAPSNSMPPPPAPSSSSPPPGLMRPPALKPTPNPSSSLSVPGSGSGSGSGSARPSPLPQRAQARQPGTSTLAPPPTHNSRPAKPSSRSSGKVTLEPGCSPLDWARLANDPASDLRGLPPGTPYLRVPPSRLRAQNGRRGRDAWTAMGGRVYNVTPYLRFHPGGQAELLRGAGRDGTRLFGEVHPWVNYETMLASCLVGVLVAEGDVGEGKGEGNGEMDEMD
ncbi:hypothetical protein SLS62_000917 [Diatrype stigma]|uniref:Cytochrome b5 heme-binding domain-containing protein n=1 Tax=Diatrype stigma TaxID=117547 RepID=A0AAN9V0I0_9PEZI